MSTITKTVCCISNRFFDVAIFGFVASATLTIIHFLNPFERGFFCSDESIRYPFKKDTVPDELLALATTAGPIILLIICEIVRAAAKRAKCLESVHYSEKYDLKCWRFPASVAQSYKYIGYFAFGAAINVFLTFMFKYQVGALRPHFLAVCKPNMTQLCSGDVHQYIEHIVCTGDAAEVKDSRQSFLSGHSSMALYAAAFLIIYLQGRFRIDFLSRLLVPLIQVILLALALFTALSRVTDYHHHSSDVMGGSLLGIIVAAAVLIPRADVFNKQSVEDDDDEHSASIVYRRGI